MAKYVFAYHGGAKPETEEEGEAVMEKWTLWFRNLGAAIIDGGNPVGQSHTVSASGVTPDGGANPISGYSLIEAVSLEAAVNYAKGCPILEVGGTVEVAEAINM